MRLRLKALLAKPCLRLAGFDSGLNLLHQQSLDRMVWVIKTSWNIVLNRKWIKALRSLTTTELKSITVFHLICTVLHVYFAVACKDLSNVQYRQMEQTSAKVYGHKVFIMASPGLQKPSTLYVWSNRAGPQEFHFLKCLLKLEVAITITLVWNPQWLGILPFMHA